MVFMSNRIFDFDLFDLMRYVDGKQLMLGRSVTQPLLPTKEQPGARIDRRTCLRSLHATDRATAPGVRYE